MIDKVQKIREEVERLKLCTMDEHMAFYNDAAKEDYRFLSDIEELIKALQEEPVSKVYTFKSIPRLLDMIQPSGRANTYITKLADSLDEQGYHTDAKIVRESIKIMNGDKVAMATMDEEPVSEDLGEIVLEGTNFNKSWYAHPELAFKAGAKWQKEQFEKDYTDLCNGIATAKGIAVAMAYDKGVADTKEQMVAKAIDGHVTFEFYGLDSKTYGTIVHDPICLDDFGLKDTDKVKVIAIKED